VFADEYNIRIISARKSTKSEIKEYKEYIMKKEYHFRNSIQNPYAKKVKKQI
jgi:hypothetical protein